MPRYPFTSNGHDDDVKPADDECSYEWKVESKGIFSPTFTRTIRRDGEIVLKVEVP